MRISVNSGRTSRLKRFLSMPKNLGASRKRTKRGGKCVEDSGVGWAVKLAHEPNSMRSRSLTHGLRWTLADAPVRER